MLIHPTITFARLKDMYGTCKCIRVLVDGEQAGDARMILIRGKGLVWFCGADAYGPTETEMLHDLSISNEEMWARVEAELERLVRVALTIKHARAA